MRIVRAFLLGLLVAVVGCGGNGGDEAGLAAQCERLHAFYVGKAGAIGPQSPPTQRGVR